MTKAKAKEEAFEKILPVFQKELADGLHEQSGMDESIEKRSHPQKDHDDQRRLCEQRYV